MSRLVWGETFFYQAHDLILLSSLKLFHQLTQQLDDLRRGRLQLHSVAPAQGLPSGSHGAAIGQKGSPLSGPAALELRKLYQELQVHYTPDCRKHIQVLLFRNSFHQMERVRLALQCFRLVIVITLNKAASWPRTRSC